MAFGIDFKGSNRTLGAPNGMTEEQVYGLPVMLAEDNNLPMLDTEDKLLPGKFHKVSVSCWQLDEQELEELKNNGGKIFIKCIGMQPAMNITPVMYTGLNTEPYDKKDEQQAG